MNEALAGSVGCAITPRWNWKACRNRLHRCMDKESDLGSSFLYILHRSKAMRELGNGDGLGAFIILWLLSLSL